MSARVCRNDRNPSLRHAPKEIAARDGEGHGQVAEGAGGKQVAAQREADEGGAARDEDGDEVGVEPGDKAQHHSEDPG